MHNPLALFQKHGKGARTRTGKRKVFGKIKFKNLELHFHWTRLYTRNPGDSIKSKVKFHNLACLNAEKIEDTLDMLSRRRRFTTHVIPIERHEGALLNHSSNLNLGAFKRNPESKNVV